LKDRVPMGRAKQNWNAADYAGNSSAQLQWAEELIARLALKGSESVLDIGCGDGKVSALMARAVRNGHVVGIDSSESMIGLAGEQFPPTSHPNLSFRLMDAMEIRFSEKFDVAFSNATLHWVNDQTAVLRGVRSCLKPGGRILFQMGGRGNAAEIFDIMGQAILSPRWRGYFEGFEPPYRFHGPEEYEGWLSACGYCRIRAELIPKDMQHEGTEGLAGWLRTTWFPYTDRLPADLRDIFLDEVIRTFTASHPVDALGRTHVKMVRLEVEAYLPEEVP